mmetsp:Transcript_62011/g.196055  ORF Transcript_62011/g.196055 Transcript_62011/m.196055 type:complete len:250 (+) Transcript_62011:563-1312(+)
MAFTAGSPSPVSETSSERKVPLVPLPATARKISFTWSPNMFPDTSRRVMERLAARRSASSLVHWRSPHRATLRSRTRVEWCSAIAMQTPQWSPSLLPEKSTWVSHAVGRMPARATAPAGPMDPSSTRSRRPPFCSCRATVGEGSTLILSHERWYACTSSVVSQEADCFRTRAVRGESRFSSSSRSRSWSYDLGNFTKIGSSLTSISLQLVWSRRRPASVLGRRGGGLPHPSPRPAVSRSIRNVGVMARG